MTVDLSAVSFDSDRQISVVTEHGVPVPALKHSTGTTNTNTARYDNSGGADKDSDATRISGGRSHRGDLHGRFDVTADR